ncbi:MAG: hypothetical protein HY654_11745, partial [Acidobacteria bacterium]|nr:hypothetical protein [Acidobacteriota bacterium]
VLYAAAYQRRRAPWGFNGGGPGSGIYKTTDAGRTWRKLANGLPEGPTGRIGLAIYPGNPRILYATVENARGGTFRSEDGGEMWTKMSDVNPRPMYYSHIYVDPSNERRIYVLGSSMFVSNDGGRTFADPKTGRPGPITSMSPTYDIGVHGDHHALWIDPDDSRHLMLGNDGGLYFSYDAGISWDKVNNIPLAQFYSIDVDQQTPYNIYGGLQDTHSWTGPSATRHLIGITNDDWVQINFGDGMYQRVDPNDPDVIYSESQDGNISRFHRRTGDRKNIRPYARPGEPPYRFNWTSPIVVSRHSPKTIYFGGNRVFKSTNGGESWTASQDLTRNEDRDKLAIMGVMPTRETLSRNDGVSAWGTLTTLAESPMRAGVLWAGSDDGLVHVSRDGGATWSNVTDFPGLSGRGRVSRVEPSNKDEATAYVSFDRHQDDDFAPYLFVTHDFGRTWRSIAGNLPKLGWINVVKEHPKNPRALFAGTETGLYVSLDAGAHWTRFRQLPTLPVDDLIVHPRDNDLVVATHGRSIFILDDAPFTEAAADTLNAPARLFTPRRAMLLQLWKNESYGAQRQFIGPNPPNGAILHYHLRTPGDITFVVRNAQGQVVRTMKEKGDAGFNRTVWDLRLDAPVGVVGARGPHVLPGTYTIELLSGAATSTARLEVVPDPLLPLSDGDRQARFDHLSRLNAMRAELQKTASEVATVREQIIEFLEQAKRQSAAQAVLKNAQAFADELQAAQARLGGGGQGGGGAEGFGGGGGLRGRLASLFNELDGSGVQQGTMTGPTIVQRERLAAAEADLKAAQDIVAKLLGVRLTELNDEIYRLKLPRIIR